MQIGIKLACIAVLSAALAPALAQDPSSGRFGNAISCVRDSPSRLKSKLDCTEKKPAETTVTTHQVELPPLVMSLPSVVVTDCQSTIALDYTQRGASARVKGTISNEMCPASSGSFVVSVRTMSDSGEALTQEFPETWSRADDQPVNFSADYAIGDNVDLVRVRTLRSRCKCATEETPAP